MNLNFIETAEMKYIRSETTNYNFNKITGRCEMWGETLQDDIEFSELGPLILDLEISTICNGYKGNTRCSICYKAENGLKESNMSLDTFKKIFDNLSLECYEVTLEDGKTIWFNLDCYILENDQNVFVKTFKVGDVYSFGTIKSISKRLRSTLNQCAFGSDATGIANPEVFNMMEYARNRGVIPNITVANISQETAERFSKLCGAISVSRYADKNICYDTVKKLTDLGMTQINIHQCISKYTKVQALETMNDMMTDPRLSKMNAIVLLSLKKKGNGEKMEILSQEGFNELINFAFENKIRFGMDSCSGAKFMKAIEGRPDYSEIMKVVEPCESTKISCYINVDGEYFSCSFCENTPSFPVGVDVVNSKNFLKDVWFHKSVKAWRENLLGRNRCGDYSCPAFEV
jgi:hypothetical protein